MIVKLFKLVKSRIPFQFRFNNMWVKKHYEDCV